MAAAIPNGLPQQMTNGRPAPTPQMTREKLQALIGVSLQFPLYVFIT